MKRHPLLLVLPCLLVACASGTPAPNPSVSIQPAAAGLPAISLRAKDVPLSELATALSTATGARVTVGPSVARERVSATIENQPLDRALSTLAARASIDVGLRGGGAVDVYAIHLRGDPDPIPDMNAIANSRFQALLFSGNTESTEPTSDPGLSMTYLRGRLSLDVKDRPAALVVLALSESMGIPVEVHEPGATMTLQLTDVPVAEALRQFPSSVTLFYRLDLPARTVIPVRLAVGTPPQ